MTDDIEWGEWQPGIEKRSVVGGGDYQFQRIAGKSQWRVRKAPPAPVMATAHRTMMITVNGVLYRYGMTFRTRDGAVDTSVAPTVEWVKP